jgi:hypothetical protein
VLDKFTKKSKERQKSLSASLTEKKKEDDQAFDNFYKKFGILKKASVLLFYGRTNDAFDEIAKAV